MVETTFEFGPIQTAWLEALESGKYQQGQGALNKSGRFCCLGVLLEVMGIPSRPHEDEPIYSCYIDESGGTYTNFPSGAMSVKAGLHDANGVFRYRELHKDGCTANSLVHANDIVKATFPEIAAFIRANPEAVFSKAA